MSPRRPSWLATLDPYRDRVTTARRAFEGIHHGDTLYVASACAEPQHLTAEFQRYALRLNDVEMIHLLGSGQATFDDPLLRDHVRFNCFFIGDSTRAAVERGLADYTPLTLSEIPALIFDGQLRIDAALIQVAPPDEHGMCCLGVSVETVKAAAQRARLVIAQVNPRMPRVGGDSSISAECIDCFVPYEQELLEFHWSEPNAVARTIARNVAPLIDDGSTLQIGIGKVPAAIPAELMHKRELGVHTEMFSQSLIELIEAGVVTNARKGLHPGKVVATFCVGDRGLYDYIDGNPLFEFFPADYVGDPRVIARNQKMVAIAGALEIDLTGQVCAESLGHKFYSGFGSQVDFMRGAARSSGGKPIIVIPSTAREGTVSRIVPDLRPGAGVTLTRSDVHYVVTEYGVAYLYGKSVRERAVSLIEIAHPRFRPALLNAAKANRYIFADQRLPQDEALDHPPTWSERVRLSDGEEIALRPIRPRDEHLLQELYYSLSDKDLYLRFMASDARFPHSRVCPETLVDYRNRMAIIAVSGEVGRERILGSATYDRDPRTGIAECSFTVHERSRRRGIGRELLGQLTTIARENGVAGFRVEVLAKNRPMLGLFQNGERGIHTTLEDGIYYLWYLFDEAD
ncbi:MAG: GNAT family N-acetyltransferase [Candidatus Alcyoniella australis]|nr:GNAT family N-acetyltransferase [Candidatus Alcyoniella australis]